MLGCNRGALWVLAILVGSGGSGCFSEADTSSRGTDRNDTGAETGGSSPSATTGSTGDGASDPAGDGTGTSSGDGTGDGDARCGDGVLDGDELCDEPLGCVDCVLEHYVCNPYNQVGCGAAQTCDRTRGATLADQRTGCFQEGLAGWGQPCTYDALDPALQCGDRLSCVGGGFHPSCAAAECCTAFCDRTDPAACPDPSTQCLTWKEVDMPPGLDTLGLCIKL